MTQRLTITKWIKDWFEVRESAGMSNFGYYTADESDRRLSLYLVA